MNRKNSDKLCNDFPNLYCNELWPYFYFECNDGWFSLIYDLSVKIDRYAKNKGLKPKAIQVKQKLGTLRYYVRDGDEHIIHIIDEAEKKSETICEYCGEPAVRRNVKGWLVTACDLCRFERGIEDGETEKSEEEEMLEPGMKVVPHFTCGKCGWVGFVNEDPECANYEWQCFRCGTRGKENFHQTKEGECPIGVTLQQLNCIEEKG